YFPQIAQPFGGQSSRCSGSPAWRLDHTRLKAGLFGVTKQWAPMVLRAGALSADADKTYRPRTSGRVALRYQPQFSAPLDGPCAHRRSCRASPQMAPLAVLWRRYLPSIALGFFLRVVTR